MTDPPVRKDGRCVQCLGPRGVPATYHSSIDELVYLLDPFCSGACCRKWHGVPTVEVRGGNPDEKRGRYERAAA